MSEPLLAVESVSKFFPVGAGVLPGSGRMLRAVDGVSFTVGAGETAGLVGESGCGKSTTASLVLRLARPTSGVVRYNGVDINQARRGDRVAYRRSVQAVLQDPYSSLNPRLRVRHIIGEPLVASSDLSKAEIGRRVQEVIEQVGLPAEAAGLYPHEFSGGQRQRIALARSLVLRPRLIVLDEAVSGLDVSMKAQILNLLKDLQAEYGMAYLLISHNLADVQYLCDTVMVMYLGKIVESGPVERVFAEPLHPYTRALITAAMPVEPGEAADIEVTGEVPSPMDKPQGCPFHTRCPEAMDVCLSTPPQLQTISPGHITACHLHDSHAEPRKSAATAAALKEIDVTPEATP
jgi:oligopeptide transport system ATP-binding protein